MHSGVICRKTHFPILISDNMRLFLDITSNGSHKSEGNGYDNRNLDSYLATIQTPYLLYSLTFMLCDFIIWFGEYVKDNPNREVNRSLCRELMTKGTIQKDKRGNLYVGDCLIAWRGAQEGDFVEVDMYKETENRGKFPYLLTSEHVKLL